MIFIEITQVFDHMFDANRWNEIGAIIGISTILDRINMLDSRVGKFESDNFEANKYIKITLPSSYFPINETTTKYSLIEDNSDYIEDYEEEIIRSENFLGYSHYKNNKKTDGPRILVFSGSYFNNKEKFFTENFSELMEIHNYYNVINYDYYINIFNPDIVLFESTEYTHTNHYFPEDDMINTIHNNYIKNYENLNKDDFVSIDNTEFGISDSNLTNFSIHINGEDVLYVYAYIGDRILDGKIVKNDSESYMEFSIMSSEIKDLKKFNLYFISKDEERYAMVNCSIK